MNCYWWCFFRSAFPSSLVSGKSIRKTSPSRYCTGRVESGAVEGISSQGIACLAQLSQRLSLDQTSASHRCQSLQQTSSLACRTLTSKWRNLVAGLACVKLTSLPDLAEFLVCLGWFKNRNTGAAMAGNCMTKQTCNVQWGHDRAKALKKKCQGCPLLCIPC